MGYRYFNYASISVVDHDEQEFSMELHSITRCTTPFWEMNPNYFMVGGDMTKESAFDRKSRFGER